MSNSQNRDKKRVSPKRVPAIDALDITMEMLDTITKNGSYEKDVLKKAMIGYYIGQILEDTVPFARIGGLIGGYTWGLTSNKDHFAHEPVDLDYYIAKRDNYANKMKFLSRQGNYPNTVKRFEEEIEELDRKIRDMPHIFDPGGRPHEVPNPYPLGDPINISDSRYWSHWEEPTLYDRLLQPTATEKLLYGDAMPTGADWKSRPAYPTGNTGFLDFGGLDMDSLFPMEHVPPTFDPGGIPGEIPRPYTGPGEHEALPTGVNWPASRPTITLGSAINTAYDLFSFSDVMTNVINGRRSDPGAYISLANYSAQGLNWVAGDNGVQDIVSPIGDLKDPFETVSHATGTAGSA